MEVDNIYGMEIVRGTSLTPTEYEDLSLQPVGSIEPDGTKELEISLSVLERDIDNALESFKVLTTLHSLPKENQITMENYPYIYHTLRHIHSLTAFQEKFDLVSVEDFASDLDISQDMKNNLYKPKYSPSGPGGTVIETEVGYQYYSNLTPLGELAIEKVSTMAKRIYDVTIEAISYFFDNIKQLIRLFLDYCKNKDRVSNQISSKLRYIVKTSPLQSLSLKFTAKEASYFTIDDKLDILETMSIYISLLESFTSDKTKITNLQRVANSLIPKQKDYLSSEPDLVKLYIDPCFPILKKEKDKVSSCYKFTGPTLPKGYQLLALLPSQKDYDNSTTSEKIEMLNIADTSLVKVVNTYPASEQEVVLDKELLTKINNLQINFNQSCSYAAINLRKQLALLDELNRTYSKFQRDSKEKPNNYTLTYLNNNLAVVAYLARTIKEPLISLTSLAQATNDILLTKLTNLIEDHDKLTKEHLQ